MHRALAVSAALASVLPSAAGFAGCDLARRSIPRPSQSSTRPRSSLAASLEDGELDRRDAIGRAFRSSAAVAASALAMPFASNADIEGVANIPRSDAPPTSSSSVEGVTVFKTKSGLQYIDLAEGSGTTPKYGDLVAISYKGYIKLPDIKGKPSKLDEFDSDKAYLIKHGNGRTVPGLDEGLHTMRVGSKRRLIVPPKLGYVSGGLGPVPSGPYGRYKLNSLLDKMVEVRGGNFIFDVEVKSIIQDEADQGYYGDESLSPDDFNTLRQNIEGQQQAARAAKMAG